MRACLIKEEKLDEIRLLQIDLSSIMKINEEILTIGEQALLNSFSNEKRMKEIYGSILLKNSCFPNDEIIRDIHGRPSLLKNQQIQISISHSKNHLLFAYASHPIGIDIEMISEKVCKVSSKFLSLEEQNCFDTNSPLEMTQIWTLKEAMYKLANDPTIQLKDDILIYREDFTFKGKVFLSNKRWYQTEFHTFAKDNFVISLNKQPLVQE